MCGRSSDVHMGTYKCGGWGNDVKLTEKEDLGNAKHRGSSREPWG